MNIFEKQSQNTVPYSIDGTDQDTFPVHRPAVCNDFASDIPATTSPDHFGDLSDGGDARPEFFV